jgi:hypothetical protein
MLAAVNFGAWPPEWDCLTNLGIIARTPEWH